jgi:hypothetical protein
MRARAVLVATLVVMAAPAALAQGHKCPPAGTEVWTTLIPANGKPIRYEGQQDFWCLRTRDGKPINSELGHVAFYARANMGSESAMKLRDIAAQLWPLAPGKSATTVVRGVSDGSSAAAFVGQHIYRWEFNVEPAQSITVPAGTFTVLPIVQDVIGEGGNYHRGRYTYYYAPDLGTNVKFDYKVVHGSNGSPPQPWELVSIKTPGK